MNIHRSARTCAAGRVLLIDRVMRQGWSVERTAAAAGISKRTVYKWLRRFKLEGAGGLADRSRGRSGRRTNCHLKRHTSFSSSAERNG